MRKKMRDAKSTVDLFERIDAIPIRELERIRAKAHLARTEYVAEALARLAAGVKKRVRSRIVRPLKRVLGAAGA